MKSWSNGRFKAPILIPKIEFFNQIYEKKRMDEIYEKKDFIGINLHRPLNCGNFILSTRYLFVKRDFYVLEQWDFSETVVKIFDEIITNASDSIVKHGGTYIKIAINNGCISVENDGPGIHIYKMGEKYSAQVILSEEFSSSNYKNKEACTGGLNGIGAKITNIYSKWFQVETVCSKAKTLYRQVFENNSRIIHPPEISEKPCERSFTKISFIPDWRYCVRYSEDHLSENWQEKNEELISLIIRRRCAEVAAYSRARISFNGEILPQFDKFVAEHSAEYCIHSGDIKVAVCFGAKSFHHVSIINGISIAEFPNYAESLVSEIEEFIWKHSQFRDLYPMPIEKSFPTKLFRKYITFITVFKSPRENFTLNGNAKSCANLTKKALLAFKRNHLPKIFLAKIWTHVADFLIKNFKPQNVNINNCKPSFYVRAGKLPARGLFVVEGNSAAELIQKLITKSRDLGSAGYGIYSTKGVPPNAIKSTNFYSGVPIQTERLRENEILQALVKVLGLSYTEKRKPRYDCIILATDQDLDGIGKICSLVFCFFCVYFPDLVKAGFVKRFRTPILRVYKTGAKIRQVKSRVKKAAEPLAEFYSEQDYETIKGKKDWINQPHEVFYFKGLGGHDACEVILMSSQVKNNIIDVAYDDEGIAWMYRLYGKDPEQRKTAITTYTAEISHDSYADATHIKLSEHFKIESLAEQTNNISRMTPDICDGLRPCSRKVLATVKKFRHMTKISALAGAVHERMNYHHGEASMNVVIAGCASTIPGGNIDPILLPVSDSIGSLRGGLKEFAAPRYTDVIYNDLMDKYFPAEDDCLLNYSEQEGNIYEPDYYVPIVPRILIENTVSVATGWNNIFVGRDRATIIKMVRISIQTYPQIFMSDLYGFINGRVSVFSDNGKYSEISLGRVKEDREKNTIHITELPFQLWSSKIVERCQDEIVEEVIDNTSDVADIKIILKPDAWEKIDTAHSRDYLTAVEEYFGIYTVLHRRLNFMYKKRLIEFNSIREIFSLWFEERKTLYEKRLAKILIKKHAQTQVAESKYNFLTLHKGKIDDLEDDARDQYLSSAGFPGIDEKKINAEIFCSVEEYRKLIYRENCFEYIYNLTEAKSSKPRLKKLREKIDALQTEYKKIRETTWQNEWLRELSNLE